MGRAVFLDRDGVIIDNRKHYYIWKSEQLTLIDGISENLRLLQQKGFQLFIVSNQGGISRDLYTKEDILKLIDIYHNTDWSLIAGYRPWTNWNFIKSLKKDEIDQLASEIVGYIRRNGIKDPEASK